MEWGGSPLICVPLKARTVDAMAVEMGCAAAAGADVVEILLDRLTTFHPRQDLEFLLSRCPLPAIVSYRPAWEGGEYEGDEESRLRALELAVKLGAHYVDVELQNLSSAYGTTDPRSLSLLIIMKAHLQGRNWGTLWQPCKPKVLT